MQGSCNFIDENNNRCNKTYQLHSLYFKDPTSNTPEFADLCKWHYDKITDELIERTRGFQMKLANMISENARLTKIARANGVYHANSNIQQKISDMKDLIRKVQNNECKNYFCNANLSHLERYQKVYSVHAFKPSGRRHYSFYYCSFKCFNIMRAKCGLYIPLSNGQMVLNL